MDKSTKVQNLLKEVSRAYQKAYVIEHGKDSNWAIWYSNHLLDSPEFISIVGANVSISQLCYALMAVQIDIQTNNPDLEWSEYYCQNLQSYLNKAGSS